MNAGEHPGATPPSAAAKPVVFIAQLPPALQEDAFSREQALLAESKRGEHELAIAGLKQLIELQGETPERLGLIGGRYKKLWRERRERRLEQGRSNADLREMGYLSEAIGFYRRGAELDLNAYYCLCNLPGLLRSRASGPDLEEADFFDRLTLLVCELHIQRGQDDGWTRATLLGAAFRLGDVARVQALSLEMAREGPAAWQLESTLADAADAVAAVADAALRAQLAVCIDQLSDLLAAD